MVEEEVSANIISDNELGLLTPVDALPTGNAAIVESHADPLVNEPLFDALLPTTIYTALEAKRERLESVQQLAESRSDLGRRSASQWTELDFSPEALARLTYEQVEILEYALSGMTSVEIGRKLGISRRTVEGQLYKSYRRLKLKESGEEKESSREVDTSVVLPTFFDASIDDIALVERIAEVESNVAQVRRSLRRHRIGSMDEVAIQNTLNQLLSKAEIRVLWYAAFGMTDQAIADEIFLSKRTVSNHIGSILKKFGVSGRRMAIKEGVIQGYLDPKLLP